MVSVCIGVGRGRGGRVLITGSETPPSSLEVRGTGAGSSQVGQGGIENVDANLPSSSDSDRSNSGMNDGPSNTSGDIGSRDGNRWDRLETWGARLGQGNVLILRSTTGYNVWSGSQKVGDRTVSESSEFLFLSGVVGTEMCSLGRALDGISDEMDENEDMDESESRIMYAGRGAPVSNVGRVGGVCR